MKDFKQNCFVLIAAVALTELGVSSLQAQTTVLPSTYALPASMALTNEPGFIWNISEVLNSEPNELAWAEGQLLGLEGTNYADPTAQGVALAPALPANPATAPISFVLTNVINLSRIGGTVFGDFFPDDQMPGIPGTGPNDGTDNIAAEALTYLLLPAGTNALGVNSDDGFRLMMGGAAPQDKFALDVGQFDGGRGSADTIFQVVVQQAGLYAARLLYENGGGDANVEFFTILDGVNGTNKVLVNDLANGGIPAYRAVSPTQAYSQKVDPAPSATGVSPLEGIHIVLVDGSIGSTPVSQGSISLSLDGTALTPVLTRGTNSTSIDYTLPAPWTSGSQHSAAFAFNVGRQSFTNNWTFVVQYYIALDASWRATNVDTNQPGFIWNIFANSDPTANTKNSNERAEADLSLQAVDANGVSLANLADPNAVGAAIGPGVGPTTPSGVVRFEIPTAINLDIALTNMPGAPSTDGTTDGQAAEVLTYIPLPVGVITMQVDSDDGFRLYAGSQPADVFGRAVVGEDNDGIGPVSFSFLVTQPGTYPFRLVWENGTGGSHLIWSSLDSTGKATLINDVTNGGFPAYRAPVAGTVVPPFVTGTFPVPALHQMEAPATNVTLVIADGTNPVDTNSVTLTIDGRNITPVNQRLGNYLSVSDNGTGLPGFQLPSDVHTATVTYKDSTGAYSRTQQWSFNNIQSLILPANPVVQENFDSDPEATSVTNTVPPGWTAWNYSAEDTPGWDLTTSASDSFKNWIVISTTTMTGLESSSESNDPNQTINGQPVTTIASGNVLWAQSDGRNGVQAQFCTSAPFNLSTVNNPVMTYSSLMRMSNAGNAQADGIEYSIDGGNTWLPGVIYVTIAYSTEANIILTQDGSIDVVRTLTVPYPSLVWTDPTNGLSGGGDFAGGPAEPVTQSLAPYLAPRSDNTLTSTKVDAIRLPMAANQKDVRLRFYQLGNNSWWWGVDNLAFYDIAPTTGQTTPPPHIDSIADVGGNITVKWSNGGTLQSSLSLSNPSWISTGNSSGTFTEAATASAKYYRVSR